MAATVTKTHVLNLLELRFDYQSARNILTNWRKAAGIKEDLALYAADQLGPLADFVEANNEGASEVADKVRQAAPAGDAKPAKVEAKPEPEPAKPSEKREDRDKGKKRK